MVGRFSTDLMGSSGGRPSRVDDGGAPILLVLLRAAMVACASCVPTKPTRHLNARTYIIDEYAGGVGHALGTGGSGCYCDDELNKYSRQTRRVSRFFLKSQPRQQLRAHVARTLVSQEEADEWLASATAEDGQVCQGRQPGLLGDGPQTEAAEGSSGYRFRKSRPLTSLSDCFGRNVEAIMQHTCAIPRYQPYPYRSAFLPIYLGFLSLGLLAAACASTNATQYPSRLESADVQQCKPSDSTAQCCMKMYPGEYERCGLHRPQSQSTQAGDCQTTARLPPRRH
jgi:hypothetical protein